MCIRDRAYIGDAAYEIVIRTILVRKANMQVNKLHRHAAGLVKAEKQSAMIEILEPLFTEEEKQIYKRGRNAKSYTLSVSYTHLDVYKRQEKAGLIFADAKTAAERYAIPSAFAEYAKYTDLEHA